MPLLWMALSTRADVVVPTTAPPVALVPMAQQECFQAQFLLRLPQLEGLSFVEAVKSLRDIDPDDEAASARRITALSGQALALRRDEAQAFSRLAPLLKTMGAPVSLQSWAAAEGDALSQPLSLTKDEAKQAKTEPEVAALLATLDETDALTGDMTPRLTTLALWTHLTQGRAGTWAADVGDVTAFLHVSRIAQREPRVSVLGARRLRDTAPPATPPTVGVALSLLVPAGGNLSDLAPPAAVPLATVAEADDALLAAFNARALVASPSPGP